MSASKKSMTDSGRSTSDRSGWVAYMKRRAGSWITSAEQLAERVGITRECVTNQLITKCHLSSELFTPRDLAAELPRMMPRVALLKSGIIVNCDHAEYRTRDFLIT